MSRDWFGAFVIDNHRMKNQAELRIVAMTLGIRNWQRIRIELAKQQATATDSILSLGLAVLAFLYLHAIIGASVAIAGVAAPFLALAETATEIIKAEDATIKVFLYNLRATTPCTAYAPGYSRSRMHLASTPPASPTQNSTPPSTSSPRRTSSRTSAPSTTRSRSSVLATRTTTYPTSSEDPPPRRIRVCPRPLSCLGRPPVPAPATAEGEATGV